MPSSLYAAFRAQVWQAAFSLLTDALKVGLLTSAYTPNYDTDTYWSDVSANEVAGTGYTAGGQVLSGPAISTTAANSWTVTWAAATPTTLNQLVRPTVGNGYVYRCVVAGTTGATQPTWPTTVGLTVTDGGVTWTCAGTNVCKFTATNPVWTSATIAARYAVLYKSTGVATTSRLIGTEDLGQTYTSTNGNFTVLFDAANGILNQL